SERVRQFDFLAAERNGLLSDNLNRFSDGDHSCLCLLCLPFVPFVVTKTERPVLDRPLKVGGDIQPRLVTVLTPATTFTVDGNFSQKARRVNSVEQFNLKVRMRTQGTWKTF